MINCRNGTFVSGPIIMIRLIETKEAEIIDICIRVTLDL